MKFKQGDYSDGKLRNGNLSNKELNKQKFERCKSIHLNEHTVNLQSNVFEGSDLNMPLEPKNVAGISGPMLSQTQSEKSREKTPTFLVGQKTNC